MSLLQSAADDDWRRHCLSPRPMINFREECPIKQNRLRPAAALLAAAALLLAAGCQAATEEEPGEASADVAQLQSTEAGEIRTASGDYPDSTWDEADATFVTLRDDHIEISGSGAAAADGPVLTITGGGTYVLSGTLSAGQVVVDATKDDTVRLVLNGVDITSDRNAAIYCTKADRLIVTLEEDTRNTLTDATDYVYADAENEEPDAALFSKNDLFLNGGGALTVTANFNNGIGTKDDLVITGGTLNVTAANHGMRGRDSVTITDGTFAITAGNDGIQSNNANDGKGRIALEGGTYSITADHDGIQAESELVITGGRFAIVTGGGSAASVPVTAAEESDSHKGLKAEARIAIRDGVFDLDCLDDAIHSNGDILITGGTFALASGDDGIHADNDLTIEDGIIDISTSYEGLEAMTMTLAGGSVSLVAADDGINVAGGNDSGGMGRFGQDSFSGSSERWLLISGGHITVFASGDGIDINGNGEMTGGEVYVHGPTSGGDAAIDYDGTFLISGGVLAAAGSSGMAQAPANSSDQATLMVWMTEWQQAGAEVALQDADGNALIRFAPEKTWQNLVLSAPGLVVGADYTLLIDGQAVLTVTLSDTLTSVSDTGEAVTGGMTGGRGGFGGGTPGGGGPGGGFGGERGDGMGEPPQGGAGGERPEGDRGGMGTPPESGPGAE